MKIIQIFLLILFVTTLISCSKDDTITNSVPTRQLDTVIYQSNRVDSFYVNNRNFILDTIDLRDTQYPIHWSFDYKTNYDENKIILMRVGYETWYTSTNPNDIIGGGFVNNEVGSGHYEGYLTIRPFLQDRILFGAKNVSSYLGIDTSYITIRNLKITRY